MEGADIRATRPKSRQSIAHIPSLSKSNLSEKQNTTVDLSALSRTAESKALSASRKTRGKSLGPGGLEALKESTGNSLKHTAVLQVKSILKPTIPLTPPKVIPSFDELRKRSTGKAKSPSKNGIEDLLIDFSTPAPSRDIVGGSLPTGVDAFVDPFSPIRNSDAQNTPSLGVEEPDNEEKRQAEKRAILERRAARRKSMANRRVSFAPEATLHTWSVMELVEDSTTSSAANSTRRQSTMNAAQSSASKEDSQTVSSTPMPFEEIDEPLVKQSPISQTDPSQRKQRRSSGISVDIETSADDVFSSSPSGDMTTESSPVRVEDSIDSESDSDGDTAMSMDDATSNTINTQASVSSTQSSLDERLRQAASLAGTRGISYDEHGDDDLSMEMVTGTVTNAFQPWVREQQDQVSRIAANDEENKFPNSREQSVQQQMNEIEDDEATQGMTMDMTKAIGGIVQDSSSPKQSRRKSSVLNRRKSMPRRESVGEDSSLGDETMEFTTIGGGILSSTSDSTHDKDDKNINTSDDEMTMDFTTAVGGFKSPQGRRESDLSLADEANDTMDMTAAVGGILEPIEEQTEPQTDFEDDRTVAMDMTRAGGQILRTPPSKRANTGSDKTNELTYPALPDDQAEQDVHQTGISYNHVASVASETGSPSLTMKPRSTSRPKAGYSSHSTTPRSISHKSPVKTLSARKVATPTKQLTPVPSKSKTPERTPVMTSITHRSASPRKLFQAEINKARTSPASTRESPAKQHDPLFWKNDETGHQTPRVVLHAPKPHQHLRRRSSGIGIDKEGFGSPKVSELLDRRVSIGDVAPGFKLENLQKSRIRFEDPRQLEQEIDVERAEEERRESGRFIMEQEADENQEENATLQLKDMIESMTPKKSNATKSKSRKSLAVGSARGLLGKRPAELDVDDDENEVTPKRLKTVSREASPVKKIHLPHPPTKEETTGRLSRAQLLALENLQKGNNTPTIATFPDKENDISSPQHVNRFKNISSDTSTSRPTSFEDKLDNVVGAVDASIAHPTNVGVPTDEEKVSLQQFLNMTNIHFIELSTTKRRQTMAQSLSALPLHDDSSKPNSTEASFVAAATTLPLLELYQHATRELKTYISTGRKIIRSIEAETLVEQPKLFREYLDARPDVKAVMDNQFRNGKTNARLQSKEGWYTWRSQLVDGLRDGLYGIKNELQSDMETLQTQLASLDTIVPELAAAHDKLEHDLMNMQQRLANIQSLDHEALRINRQSLQVVDQDLADKQALLKSLEDQMQDKQETLAQAAELKTEMHDQTVEANRVREEHRGWSAKEVLSHKTKVDAIKEKTGWSLLTAEEDYDEPNNFGVALTMCYKDELSLFFYPSAFETNENNTRRRSGRASRSVSGPTAPISLTYTASSETGSILDLPTEKRFFLQLIRSQLHALSMMPKGSITARAVLGIVSAGWNMAEKVSEEIRLLEMTGVTRVDIRGDETLGVKVMLLLRNKSRVDLDFILSFAMLDQEEISRTTVIHTTAIYGSVTNLLDPNKSRKVQNALLKEIEGTNFGEGAWIGAVHGFEQWYQAQTKTATKSTNSESDLAQSASTEQQIPTATPPPTRTPGVKRSPLAAKKTATIQKKALPVPTSRQPAKSTITVRDVNIISPKKQLQDKLTTVINGKENYPPPPVFNLNTSGKTSLHTNDHLEFAKPAIPPELQEVMMHTPIKRVGALRRSPI